MHIWAGAWHRPRLVKGAIVTKKFKPMKKKVIPVGVNTLKRGFIISKAGKMLGPGARFTDDEVTPERLAELRKKGLIDGTLTTEEKGMITK